MPHIFSDPAGETGIGHLHSLSGRYHLVYLSILVIIIGTIVSLPFLKMQISVTAAGTIRPVTERTELHSPVSGIIRDVMAKEGELVNKDDLILQLNDTAIISRKMLLDFELTQLHTFHYDLKALTIKQNPEYSLLHKLSSPLYKQELNRYLSQRQEQENKLLKSQYELGISEKLLKDKVIAPKEHFDNKIENDQNLASLRSIALHQRTVWQQQLQQTTLSIQEKQNEYRQVLHEIEQFAIRSPVEGTIQYINHRYPGVAVSAGETICVISPQIDLIAESYILPRELGLIKNGQPCIFQVDAFNYNVFGVLTGKVISVDPDFTLINNQPYFKVRCSFDNNNVTLQNGYTGTIKKGMSLTTRFIISKRSLWQLLYDQLDDWLNPNAPVS